MDRIGCDSVPNTFQGMMDEEVVAYAKLGSERATEHLLSKYRNLVEGKARSYFLVGADHEDVVQEGMIGLFKAIRDYRADRLARFRAFADLCVTRQIITAVKTATRQKHLPLNRYVSIHNGSHACDDMALIDVLPDTTMVDPEQEAIDAQIHEYLEGDAHAGLSRFESEVLRYYLQGMSYSEMAELLSCHTKSVDNALQRAKRKLGMKLARD